MIGVCRLEIYIAESASLKDKRRVVKSLLQRVRQRFNVTANEIGSHDLWQVSEIEIATSATNRTGAEKVLQEIVKFAEADGRVEIINYGSCYY